MRLATALRYALLFALFAVFGVGLIYPIWLTIRGGFYDDVAAQQGFTLRHVLGVFSDPVQREALWNAFALAIVTTLLSIVMSLPLAVLSAKHTFPLKKVFSALVLVPLILPPFVGAIGFKAILGRYGALNALLGTEFDLLGYSDWKFWTVAFAMALHLYPIIYLNATAALANLDPALDEAAENLGVPPLQRFLKITLPLIQPGLFAGGTIVFIWSFTELGTPLMLDYYDVTAVQIFNGIKSQAVESSAQPYALTVVLLVLAVAFYVVGKVLFGGQAHAMQTRASRAAEESPLSPGWSFVAVALFTIVTALAVLPHIGVVLASVTVEGQWYRSVLPTAFTLEHYEDALGHPLAYGSIINSLKYASLAMFIDIALGLLIGYIVVRTKVRGRSVLDALAMLPLAVPGLVMAFGYVAMSLNWPFGDGHPLAGTADVLGAAPNPVPLLILAYAIRRLPYVVRATVAGLQQTSGELEEAAVNLGASTITAVRRVVVPLIMANLIAGGLLAFSFAMLEVSDSLILAQQEKHYPITKAIYAFSERLGDGHAIASAMGVWGMALLTVTLVGASVFMGKKLGAVFRV